MSRRHKNRYIPSWEVAGLKRENPKEARRLESKRKKATKRKKKSVPAPVIPKRRTGYIPSWERAEGIEPIVEAEPELSTLDRLGNWMTYTWLGRCTTLGFFAANLVYIQSNLGKGFEDPLYDIKHVQNVSSPVEESPIYEEFEKKNIGAALKTFSPDLVPSLEKAPIRASVGYSCAKPNINGYALTGSKYKLVDHIGLCPLWYTKGERQRTQTVVHEYLHWIDTKGSDFSSKGFPRPFSEWFIASQKNAPDNLLYRLLKSHFSIDAEGNVVYNHKGNVKKEAYAHMGATIMAEPLKVLQQGMICEMTDDLFSYYKNVFHPDIAALRDNCETTGPQYKIKLAWRFEKPDF